MVRNDDGYFNDVDDVNSVFKDYYSIYGTMVKVECVYVYDSVEYPSDGSIFVGIIQDPYFQNDRNEIEFKARNLLSVFEKIPADQVAGLGSTQTASEIFEKIRDHTDGSSNVIFRQWISSSSWNIESTTNYYNIATSTTLQNKTCFELMRDLAQAEGYVFYINRLGELYFENRDVNTSINKWHFHGVADPETEFRHNIIKLNRILEPYNKIYNRIRIQHDENDTTTSYHTKEESWTWGDNSSAYKYGVRTLKFDNVFLNSATAETIANGLFNEFSTIKKEYDIDTKFIPLVNVLDEVEMTYRSYRTPATYLWGGGLWGDMEWEKAGGININIQKKDLKVLKVKHDIDNLSSNFLLRST